MANENQVVISPLTSVVDAGTKVGGINPPPFVKTRVEVPEIIVVVAPLIMVVTSTAVIVIGSEGCCTIVRVMLAVHSHEVEYTAHQKLDDAEMAYHCQCT